MTIRFQPQQRVRRLKTGAVGEGPQSQWIIDTVTGVGENGEPRFRVFNERAEEWNEGQLPHVLASPLPPDFLNLMFPPVIAPIDSYHQLTVSFTDDPSDLTLNLSVDTPGNHEAIQARLHLEIIEGDDGSYSVRPTLAGRAIDYDTHSARCRLDCPNEACGVETEVTAQKIFAAAITGSTMTILDGLRNGMLPGEIKQRIHDDMTAAGLLSAQEIVKGAVMKAVGQLLQPSLGDLKMFGDPDPFGDD